MKNKIGLEKISSGVKGNGNDILKGEILAHSENINKNVYEYIGDYIDLESNIFDIKNIKEIGFIMDCVINELSSGDYSLLSSVSENSFPSSDDYLKLIDNTKHDEIDVINLMEDIRSGETEIETTVISEFDIDYSDFENFADLLEIILKETQYKLPDLHKELITLFNNDDE